MPQPVSAREGDLAGSPACGPVLRGYSGGNWMVACRPPGTPGVPQRPGARSPLPETHLHTLRPSGGFWTSTVGRPARGTAGAGAHQVLGIWLILPVVICLSQRLSHACLSISNLYGETANGSLNQLSFI